MRIVNRDEVSSQAYQKDLAVESEKHLAFLRGLHVRSITLEKPSRKSLDRYLNYWLPLVANEMEIVKEKSDLHLIPPPDIAWLWHCHRLAPSHYEKHCQDRFGKLLEVPKDAFHFQDQYEHSPEACTTRSLWKRHYHKLDYCPEETFFSLKKEEREPIMGKGVSLDSFLEEFDLLGSTERQATFLWQVSSPHFHNLEFLKEGVQKYLQFLKLFGALEREEGDNNTMPLVPSYQIDLQWHTHILKSIRDYHKDCMAISGRKVHHDDSFNDRTSDGTLHDAFQYTCKAWKEQYQDDYIIEGGMYRGEPPQEYWHPQWEPVFSQKSTPTALVLAGSISVGTASGIPAPPENWVDCGETCTFADKPTFLPPQEGALPNRPWMGRRGTVYYDKKDDYVFGVPLIKADSGNNPASPGYYHIYTKEGFEIMIQRLQERVAYLNRLYDRYLLNHCVCSPWCLTPHRREEYEKLEQETVRLSDLLAFAKAQYESPGPGASLSSDLVDKFKLGPSAQRSWHISEQSQDLPTISDIYGAAGCGGKIVRGGYLGRDTTGMMFAPTGLMFPPTGLMFAGGAGLAAASLAAGAGGPAGGFASGTGGAAAPGGAGAVGGAGTTMGGALGGGAAAGAGAGAGAGGAGGGGGP